MINFIASAFGFTVRKVRNEVKLRDEVKFTVRKSIRQRLLSLERNEVSLFDKAIMEIADYDSYHVSINKLGTNHGMKFKIKTKKEGVAVRRVA